MCLSGRQDRPAAAHADDPGRDRLHDVRDHRHRGSPGDHDRIRRRSWLCSKRRSRVRRRWLWISIPAILFEKEVFERREQSELSADDFNDIMERAQKATYGDGLDERYLQKFMWTWKPHYYSPDLVVLQLSLCIRFAVRDRSVCDLPAARRGLCGGLQEPACLHR